MTDYDLLTEQLRALTEDTDYSLSKLANAAALLYHTMEQVNWAGFYILRGDRLLLGPFQGKPACTVIALGKGVCGTAAAERRTLRVENVHRFSGHIACDSASNSEIVIPLLQDGRVVGVLDMDSPVYGRFTEADQVGLERFAKVAETFFES